MSDRLVSTEVAVAQSVLGVDARMHRALDQALNLLCCATSHDFVKRSAGDFYSECLELLAPGAYDGLPITATFSDDIQPLLDELAANGRPLPSAEPQ
jgi:hypothetical protein